MSKFDEMILVVNRATLFNNEQDSFNGFIDKNTEKFKNISNNLAQFEIKRRGDMEEDKHYKQLVSYTIVESGNETLVYKRLTGGGESRLHGLLSIGVGGHMNDVIEYSDIKNKMFTNAAREIEEEIGLKEDDLSNFNLVGLINDDYNEVGQVHVGLVFKVQVDKEKVFTNEADTLELLWEDNDQLTQLEPYESWSDLIIRDMYEQ